MGVWREYWGNSDC